MGSNNSIRGDLVIDLFREDPQYSVCIQKANRLLYIETIVNQISWSGAVGTAARKLSVSCTLYPNGSDNSKLVPPSGECGDILILRREDKDREIIRGIITDKSISGSGKTISYTAYDARWWLLKSKHDNIYRNMTADEIVASCCAQFGVPVGTLANTRVKFPSLQIVNKTVWDTIIIALTETRKVSGKKYTTKMIDGRLNLVEKVQQTHKWAIEEGVNLLESSYSESISDIFTQVKVAGKNDNKSALTALAKDDELIKRYGILQEYLEQSEAKTQSELNAIAAQKLKELSALKKSGTITAIGLDDVQAGDGIYVIDSRTGLVGGFWVESDDHSFKNRHHTMSLKLAWTDELPSIDYEAPKE